MNTLVSMLSGFLAALLLGVAWMRFWKRRRSRPGARQTSVTSSIQQMRSIGQLSVFKVLTKEIVTEIDHTWGEIGMRYLSWILSNKKMAMIFEFEIDFRYDLRSSDFQIVENGDGCLLRMPPCLHETNIRDIHFYDEQRSRFVPWLLPDLVNSIFRDGFSERDRNRLKDAARRAAEQQAETMIASLGSDVEQSAVQTLQALAKAFGAERVRFEFPHAGQKAPRDEEAR